MGDAVSPAVSIRALRWERWGFLYLRIALGVEEGTPLIEQHPSGPWSLLAIMSVIRIQEISHGHQQGRSCRQ